MSTTDSPAMRAEPDLQNCSLPNPKFQQLQEDRFRFTPVKVVKPVPRIWDRQPSTPFLARPKSRKVWKRFRSSFNSMKALQRLVSAQSGPDDHDDLYTEINTSRNEDYMRGVKRRCLVHDAEEQGEATTSRGRSFLETKWESEASGKRRKFPAYRGLVDGSEPIVADSQPLGAGDNDDSDISYQNAHDTATSGDEILPDTVESDESLDHSLDTPTRLAAPAAYPHTLHGLQSGMDGTTADIKECDDLGQPQADLPESSSLEAGPPENMEEQENDAVLDATITDDLQSGQCEPQNSATVSPESVQQTDATEPPAAAPVQDLTAEQESTLVRSALRSSLDGEDAELLNNFLSKAKAKREAKAAAAAMVTEEKADQVYVEIPDIPTPQGRRVLEDLDANSPSPLKVQLSPSKVPGKDIDEKEDQSPSSPRRSTRARSVKAPPRMTTTTTAARNTLTLRRAKGTEFVFLKKTEAQELALATRRNTRQNKGDAMLPKYTLQTLAQQTTDSEATSDDNKSARDSSRRCASAKRVSWNDERLVEYEGESGEGSSDDAAGRGGKSKNPEKRKATSSRTTRSQGPPKAGGDTVPAASTTAPTTATPRPRRVRRLGTPKPTAAVDTSASPSTSMSPPETRKRLTPKSPRTALAGSGASKKVSRVSTRSDTRASLDSSSLKSSSLFKAHAGSTPMPRRVRS